MCFDLAAALLLVVAAEEDAQEAEMLELAAVVTIAHIQSTYTCIHRSLLPVVGVSFAHGEAGNLIQSYTKLETRVLAGDEGGHLY